MPKKTDVVSTRLPPKLSGKFHALCRKQEKVPSELLREMVSEGVSFRMPGKVRYKRNREPQFQRTVTHSKTVPASQPEPAEVAS